jgi:glyoxylase-like metal-dependent hydrolase (beta-lactamase superfamily II)
MMREARHRPASFRHLVFIAGALLLPATSCRAADAKAIQILRQAIEAQGGEKALRAIRTVQWQAQGYRNMLEQSERPEGPYIPEFRTVSEVHDFGGKRYRSVVEMTVSPEFKGSSGLLADGDAAVRLYGGQMSMGNADMLATAREALALSPEHLLITALDAKDARLDASALLQSVPQDVVAFTYDAAPVRLFLNRYTHLPTAVDYSGPAARDGYWQFLGDATMRTYFSFWWLGQQDVRLPMQWDIYRNGLHDSSYTIASLSINAPIPEGDMRIPDSVRARFAQAAAAPTSSPSLQAAVDVAPGILLIPGSWNVLLVRQDDGVVVVEAPISSAYSELVLAEARRHYPNLPVKAVVTTSDAWPHIAGLRPYVARGIPVYCLALNLPILTRLVQAHYSTRPDLLERTPRKPLFRPVAEKVTLGSGANRIELYPIRGETSERQVMAYLPALRLLYGSDTFQKSDGHYDTPQTVSELIDAVSREGLSPEKFVMMHVEVTPWADLRKAASSEHRFPDGKLD